MPRRLPRRSPPPQPNCSGKEFRQLDFWVGEWRLEFEQPDGKTVKAVNRITRDEYGACVITEHFHRADTDYRGHSVSMYDAKSGRWRQTWVDNQGAYIALEGGPVADQQHAFEFRTMRLSESQPFARMIWQDLKPDSFTWRWQKRPSETDPWQDAWVIRYSRTGTSPAP